MFGLGIYGGKGGKGGWMKVRYEVTSWAYFRLKTSEKRKNVISDLCLEQSLGKRKLGNDLFSTEKGGLWIWKSKYV